MRLHLTARGSDPTPPACANSTAHGCPGAAHDSANSPDSADAPMKQDISKLPMDSPGDGNGESEDPSNEINDNDVTKVKPIIIWDSDEKLEDACKAGEMKKCKDQREKNKGHRDFQIELHFDVCMSNTQGLGKRGKGFYDLCWYEKGIREGGTDEERPLRLVVYVPTSESEIHQCRSKKMNDNCNGKKNWNFHERGGG